jgi:hypothetical protein
MAYAEIERKTGNGAFRLATNDDGDICIWIEDAGSPARFGDYQRAYDWCLAGYSDLQGTMRGYAYLNAAYALEDMPRSIGEILGEDENVGACEA